MSVRVRPCPSISSIMSIAPAVAAPPRFDHDRDSTACES